MSRALDHASTQLQASVDALIEILRIPSISAMPEYAEHTRAAADFTVAALKAAGMENARAEQPSTGYPVIRGDWLGAPGKPTVLLYGHYDVQPADPLDEWTSPPFEPVIRDGKIYARGADDNKGQMMAIIKAVEALMETEGGLPVNVKFAIEGEEESGGKALPNYLRDNREEMAGDTVFVADSAFVAPGQPAILTGLRGLVYTEIEATGAAQDLHSGAYGGAAPNPINALAWVIAGLKDERGRVLVPGFYDRVTEPDEAELASWKALNYDIDKLLHEEIGSSAFFGEQEYSIEHRLMARPTLDVHGIRGGFTGDGAKTVIPARATAKVSMRLVPDQDPLEVYDSYQRYVQSLATPGISLVVRPINQDPPVSAPIDGRGVQALGRAYRRAVGAAPVYLRMGGSIPVCTAFQESLGAELVMTGFGLPDDRLHSPNEKYDISQYEAGIRTTIAFLEEMAGA